MKDNVYSASIVKKSLPYLVLAGLCLAHGIWLYSGHAIDDAYITYRYAYMLAQGQGFAFNPGQYVEGFTSPLWVMLVALIHLIFSPHDPHPIVQTIGMLCWWGAACFTFASARILFQEQEKTPIWSWIPALLLAFRPGMAGYALSGMESTCFVFLTAWGIWIWLRKGIGLQLGLVFGIASLARPETPYVFGVFLFFHGYWEWYSRRHSDPGTDESQATTETSESFSTLPPTTPLSLYLWCGLAFALCWGSWVVWRLLYFGELLPNTYYAKKMPLEMGYQLGLKYLTHYMQQWFWLPLVFALLAWLSRSARLRLITAVWVMALLPILRLGADWMPQYRFILHHAAWEVLVWTGALWTLHRFCKKLKLAKLQLTTLAALGLFALSLHLSWAKHASLIANGKAIRQIYASIGQWIHQTPAIRSVAVMDIGSIGYFARHKRILDLSGLTDRFIARKPGIVNEKRYNGRYILKQKPDVIILHTRGSAQRVKGIKYVVVSTPTGQRITIDVSQGKLIEPHKMFRVERNVYLHPLFHKNYRYLRSKVIIRIRGVPIYVQHFFVRKTVKL